jgi:hypothetical protein
MHLASPARLDLDHSENMITGVGASTNVPGPSTHRVVSHFDSFAAKVREEPPAEAILEWRDAH